MLPMLSLIVFLGPYYLSSQFGIFGYLKKEKKNHHSTDRFTPLFNMP